MSVTLTVNYKITGSIVITKYFEFIIEQGVVHSTQLPTFPALAAQCRISIFNAGVFVPHPIDVQLVKPQDGVITLGLFTLQCTFAFSYAHFHAECLLYLYYLEIDYLISTFVNFY